MRSYVWLFIPTGEVLESNCKTWPKRKRLYIWGGDSHLFEDFWENCPPVIAKHQFEFLGPL